MLGVVAGAFLCTADPLTNPTPEQLESDPNYPDPNYPTSSSPSTTVKLPKPAKIAQGSALQRLAMGAAREDRRRC